MSESDDPFEAFDRMWKQKEEVRQKEQYAVTKLPPAQRNLDYGDYWVLPFDGTVAFGYVPTLIEQAAWFSENLLPQEQVDEMMIRSQYEMSCGWMTCEIEDERWYWIHKALVIPIEPELYDRAREADWDPTEMDEESVAYLTEMLAASREETDAFYENN